MSDEQVRDILIIGAGFAGVCCGIKLLQSGKRDFVIVEKSQGIGGTWWDNTYPGVTCDVPSHFYCYSFEPNPNWSHVYSPGSEIQSYVENCADKYGVRPFIRHGTKVVSLTFDEAAGHWLVQTSDGSTMIARHVINAAGALHQPVWPDIRGKELFAGASMHTARWDHSVDWSGKKLGIIGSAASAIQVIPEIARNASKVVVFHRTANYIVPRNDSGYSESTKSRFAKWPWLNRLYRHFIFLRLDLLLYRITQPGSFYSRYATRRIKQYIRDTVSDPALAEKMVPDYHLGCKRILVSDDIFDAYNSDNVDVVTDSIRAIDKTGVVMDDGSRHDVDILVYATGYDIEAHFNSIHVAGREGKSLAGEWEAGAEAFDGCLVAGFPNYFMVTGPNTGVGTTSVVFMIEQSVRHILSLIAETGRGRTIEVKRETQQAYNRRLHERLGRTVWATGCKSWYRRDDGKIPVLYPGNAREFRRQLRNINLANYTFSQVGGDRK